MRPPLNEKKNTEQRTLKSKNKGKKAQNLSVDELREILEQLAIDHGYAE